MAGSSRGTQKGRSHAHGAASLALVAALVGGCGSTTGTPPVPATAPSATEQSAGTPVASAPQTPPPTPEPTPIPSWTTFTVPDGRSAQVLDVGTDGTVYVTTFDANDSLVESNGQLLALGPDGSPRSGWSSPAFPEGDIALDALAAPDGGLYLALGPDPAANTTTSDSAHATILRLAADGSTVAGWPVTLDTTSLGSRLELAGPDLCFSRYVERNSATVECLGPDGTRPSGWPLTFDTSVLLSPVPAADGTIYVAGYTVTFPKNKPRPTAQRT